MWGAGDVENGEVHYIRYKENEEESIIASIGEEVDDPCCYRNVLVLSDGRKRTGKLMLHTFGRSNPRTYFGTLK